MNRRLTIGAVVIAILAIVGIGYAIQSSRDTTGNAAVVPTATETATDQTVKVAAADTYGLGVGNPDAPVKIEIFEDFLCPFCQQYEETGREQLRAQVADGKAYVVYRPIAFLNEYSARALNTFAVVLEKAGPDVALKFHDRLYDEQPAETGTMPDNQWLIDQAVAVGAKAEDITAGIDGYAFKQWIINGADDASKRGVNGTPTVFANGAPLQGISIADLVHKTQTAIEDGGS
jgi:protein-disulfide isomerase